MQAAKWIVGAVLCATLIGLGALSESASGQVATIKGKGKLLEVVEDMYGEIAGSVGNAGSPQTEVYTVPEGRSLIITDMIFSNLTAIDGVYVVLVGQTTRFAPGPTATIVASFGTGFVYGPGETVSVSAENLGTDGGRVSFVLRGYLQKAK